MAEQGAQGPSRQLSDREETRLLDMESNIRRATFLELFLDLVFVFALTRISLRLVTDFTSHGRILVVEAGQSLLLFLVLWLIWVTNAHLTSRMDPDAPVVQFVVLLTMVGSMVMAIAVPEGFGERSLILAAAYVAVQLGRALVLLVSGFDETDSQNPSALPRILVWSGVTAAPWLAGGIVDEESIRGVLWGAALILDYAGLTFGWPVPRLGRSLFGGRSIAGEHLAERYQQFLLIALGETILTIGVTTSDDTGLTRDRAIGFGLAMLTTMQLWRIYFFRAGHVLPQAITSAREPVRFGLAATYTHLVMVAGIVLAGVGYELFIDHPSGRVVPAWLFPILGGPALFLAGRAGFEFQVFGRISRSRVAGILALGLLAPAALFVAPLAAGGIAVAVLLGVVVVDALRSHGRTDEAPAPPV